MMNSRKISILIFSMVLALFLSFISFAQEEPRKTLDDYDPTVETGKPDPAQETETLATSSDFVVKSKDVKKDGSKKGMPSVATEILGILEGFNSIIDQILSILGELENRLSSGQGNKPPPKPLKPEPTHGSGLTASSPGSTPSNGSAASGGSAPSDRASPSAGAGPSNSTSPSGGSTGSNTPAPPDPGVATAPVPAENARGGLALLGWLQQTGFTGEALRTAWAIGMRESRGNPRALNNNQLTRDESYGLFQINMRRGGEQKKRLFGITSNDELLDPLVNCRAMMILSRNGTDFGPWGLGPNAYRRSAQLEANFRRFYDQFPP